VVPDSDRLDFVVSVDELGSNLVVGADELVIGHARGSGVDLPFLADVGLEHARLVRELSFRGGIAWSIGALSGEDVRVGGDSLGEVERRLSHGDRVELGVNLSFRYVHPDPASMTVVLELEGGVDCGGSRAIVLLAEGAPGQLRLGACGSAHLRAPALEGELVLWRSGDRLLLRGEGLERLCGFSPSAGRLEPSAGGLLELALPLAERVALELGPASASGPPFGVALSPRPSK